jgi:hypothetical protein
VFNIVQKTVDFTTNIQKLMFLLTSGSVMQYSRKGISISSFTVNITDCYRFHGSVAGHIPFATLGSHT